MTGPAESMFVEIRSEPDIVEARQLGRKLCEAAGLGNVDMTLLVTAISELARNIVRYAGKGRIEVAVEEAAGRRAVVVVATDSGPGIADVEQAMQDGFSTGQGLGLGLPGARRLVDEFEIRSSPGEGTCVRLKKWAA